MRHALAGFMCRGLTAYVKALARRIGADHQKIVAPLDQAMSGSNRQDRHVACFDARLASVRTPEHKARAAAGKSQDLVRGRMVVMKVIDAVPPLRRPSVSPEDGFEQGSGIVADNSDRALVEEHGKTRIVRDPPVPLKSKALRRDRAPGSRRVSRVDETAIDHLIFPSAQFIACLAGVSQDH